MLRTPSLVSPHLIVPPRPFDPARAARVAEALAENGLVSSDPLLAAVFGNSPFLGRLAVREHGALAEYLAAGPLTVLNAAILLAHSAARADDEAQAMRLLRTARRRAALAIATADIGGVWDVAQVTGELTRFADACVGAALRFMLRQAAKTLNQPEAQEESCGLTVLAMGKYGAHELNYSSDIDLIVFYDAQKFPFAKRGDQRGAAVDIVRGLVKLLADVTSDGYVFRVDLRLRPDAGATQIAISTDAALDYYEAMGQNWERAAMIKARPCAGDPGTGADFLKGITPFVWRRYLDFAAIEDIHSIKRQIHAHAGHGEIKVAGHNIKLGRGGIREIEFFAQTQQLILGGRHPALRVPSTQGALAALAADGRVAADTAEEMSRDYRALRMLEHRLQMIEDQQTHSLPETAEGLAHVACFMGYGQVEDFCADLTATLENVQGHYGRLFESAPVLSDTRGSLVFTGVEDDPETLETITAMGFRNASHISGAIRGWHHGRIAAMRSARARELLTRLTPAILTALAGTAGPDIAFAQFDRFLSALPSGVQLFSLFQARPHFLALLARIVGTAPRLAQHLARNPATLDALLDAEFFTTLPDRAELQAAFDRQSGATYEEVLDGARRFAREAAFRVGVQIVEGTAKAEHAGPALADVAETVIAGLLPRVEDEMAHNAGRIAGGGFCVMAMGKLGGREMTASSDLDLVFVYDMPEDTEASDGDRPLAPTTYYARLAQRLISALTTTTAAGPLYEVDMRLRPTGNKGPVAVSLKSFVDYHASESWTWEHMALTRARLVAGPPRLRARVRGEVRRRLTEKRPAHEILRDASDMRARMAETFPGKNPFDLKFAPGGLVDIEFIAQALQLVHAQDQPEILNTNTVAALHNLNSAGFLGDGDTATLVASARLQHGLTQVLRIALDDTPDIETATPGLKGLLTRAAELGSFEQLQARLAQLQGQTRAIFTRIVTG
ncbi:MAG: bifunctional [glutamine synthetase] adenylyltransferase/[glutamine synthetase]-adenylyl-L-tyrosine phosphorylase [Alphaproteobacteria bacterium]|nr:bifunctional [glutamine synthetase] adenylyltransferase/[glutamine synthetase]-adenylyl-L-tyrosine phosphorylase [Alphaproteobacteria bacterium]